jgi:phosphatidylglycerol lysyltransferase
LVHCGERRKDTAGFHWAKVPLAGLERRPLAPLWHKLGTAIFHLGGKFDNFESLYDYKAKFNHRLAARRCLVASVSLAAPSILMTVIRLNSESWNGLFTR